MAVRLQMPCNAQGSRPCKSDVSQTSVVPRLRPLLQTSLLPWGQVLSLPNPPAPATAWAALVQISSCLWLGCIRAPTTTSGGNFGALFLSLQFLPGYKKLPSSIWGLCPAPQPVGCAAPSPCRPHTRHGGKRQGQEGCVRGPSWRCVGLGCWPEETPARARAIGGVLGHLLRALIPGPDVEASTQPPCLSLCRSVPASMFRVFLTTQWGQEGARKGRVLRPGAGP